MNGSKLKFPTLLKLYKYEAERQAQRLFGFTLPDIIYEMVDFEEMAEVAARHGFPVVERHWRWGQSSILQKQQFTHGMGRLYELVINTRPVYGFLLDSNEISDQKSVMAHVCGHAHLFAKNAYARSADKDIDQAFAADAAMLDHICNEIGNERVKTWYDQALSLENLYDPNALFIKRPPLDLTPDEREDRRKKRKDVHRLESREELPPYMDDFLNPPEWIAEQKTLFEAEEAEDREIERGTKIPPYPMRDVLLFLIRYAPLEGWQRSILEMIRRKLYYFSQYRTKFIHEGWASLVQEEVMMSLGASQDKDLVRWTSMLARVQRSASLNPYKLAYELLKDISYRWDTGRHGAIWDQCDIVKIKSRWDEFIVFHAIAAASGNGGQELWQRWQEFSAFIKALKAGRLGYPGELFAKEAFTSELLIPTWVRYSNAEAEYASWEKRLARVEALGLEARIPEEVRCLRAKTSDESITDAELIFKARRDLYYAAGEYDLYLWTPQEIMQEMAAIKPLIAFKREVAQGLHRDEVLIDIPDEWREYAAKFPDSVELGAGKRKVLEVVESCDDYNFLDEFFTKDFCEKHGYFLIKAKTVWEGWREPRKHYVIETRAFERIKRRLLFQFTNFYQPMITVADANYHNGQLYLVHEHTGVDLDTWSKDGMYIQDVLRNLFHMWGGKRRVNLETVQTVKEEERPWWFSWHTTEEKEAQEWPTMVKGRRVVYSYGLNNKKEETIFMDVIEEVTYPAPF